MDGGRQGEPGESSEESSDLNDLRFEISAIRRKAENLDFAHWRREDISWT
jgi:hypothetical protein